MTEAQKLKAYEVNFLTDQLQHVFYLSCPDGTDTKTFAHAVLHYYDIPAEWGKKLAVSNIVETDIEDCLPEYLHIVLQDVKEIAMSEENEESHRAVKKIIKQIIDNGETPMAIYDQAKQTMTVYATKKMEVAPRAGVSGNVLNFE